METNTRVQIILTVLQKTYPGAKIALTYSTPWELLVAVMLSAQCTDARVNVVTKTLFAKYKTLEEYEKCSQQALEKDIRSTGFFRNKARHIRAAAKLILTKYNGAVPKTMGGLLTLPGVARKTANVVLYNAFDKNIGIAVDTHVIRLSQRLRLVPMEKIGGKEPIYVDIAALKTDTAKIIDFYKKASPEKIEAELMKLLPKSRWGTITHQIIDHGRAVCKARTPHCPVCPLSPWCPVKRTMQPLPHRGDI